jgi:hypothetical protein
MACAETVPNAKRKTSPLSDVFLLSGALALLIERLIAF